MQALATGCVMAGAAHLKPAPRVPAFAAVSAAVTGTPITAWQVCARGLRVDKDELAQAARAHDPATRWCARNGAPSRHG